MPELPEVETVRRSLEPNLIGKRITKVEVNLPKLIKIPSGDALSFSTILEGSVVTEITRRGKYLLFTLDDHWNLVIHLRMTGRLLYQKKETPIEKHTHFIFHLDDDFELRFHDVRQFGLLYLVPVNELDSIKGLKNLGAEPLDKEFTFECLNEALKGKKKRVKAFLLDQNCVAGIGNIYADEILFQAGIHPEETLDKLSSTKIKALWFSIIDRLQAGVEHRGTSIKDYVDGFGEAGTFQHQLQVYGKSGQPCPKCGKQIEKIKVVGRSTSFCPQCQKKS